MKTVLTVLAMVWAVAGCTEPHADAQTPATRTQATQASIGQTPVVPPGAQRGHGRPYEMLGTEVWDVADPVSGRDYQVFVALPKSYRDAPQRRYPVLYVTDADYAFPLVRQIARRLNGEGPAIEEFILVGLSYATGDDGMTSRRRDYTPAPTGSPDAPADAVHGKAEAYIAYLQDQVLPFVAGRYRTDEHRRLFLGHSYGGLLGTQILLTRPELFAGYVLGSPSYWFADHWMEGQESAYAREHTDLPAKAYLYVGQYEESTYGKRYDMVSDTRRMATALRSRNYPSLRLELDVLNDETHLTVAPRGFIHGLQYLLGVEADRS